MKFVLILALSYTTLTWGQITTEDTINFEASVVQCNQQLTQFEILKGCPGVNLVVSCGNLICEPHKNESTLNCPADCLQNVTVRSYNNIVLCQGYNEVQIAYSTQEVADLVKRAVMENKNVRAIGASHSATETMCAKGMLIPMDKFKTIIGIEELNGRKVVHTQAGVTIFEISEWLEERGYALDGLPHMGFRDVTIGGSMATGSHGSTAKHHGVISNIVEAIQVVDGQGEIHNYNKAQTNSTIFKGLSASLGLLGIVTEVKLRIQPKFNLGVAVTYHTQSEILKNGLINSIKDCDYGHFNWFPGIQKVMKTCGKKTTEEETPGANNELLSPQIPDFVVNPFKKVLQYGACYSDLMCMLEQVRWFQNKLQPPLVVTDENGKKKFKHYLVGPAHRMASSHLTKNQQGFFQMDWEIAVPASRAEEAFKAISKHIEENATCLPLVGVFIRFAPSEDETLIAHTVSTGGDWKKGETAVFFEMPVYIPIGFDQETFKQYEKQYVDFARMLISQYSGRPHWGKNRQWTFDMIVDKKAYGKNLDLFQEAINQLDPKGTFANDFGKGLGFQWKQK